MRLNHISTGRRALTCHHVELVVDARLVGRALGLAHAVRASGVSRAAEIAGSAIGEINLGASACRGGHEGWGGFDSNAANGVSVHVKEAPGEGVPLPVSHLGVHDAQCFRVRIEWDNQS